MRQLAEEIAVINLQHRARIRLRAMQDFVRRLRRELRIGRKTFNVCFVDDRAMRRLNATFRNRRRATDVLSFPWGSGNGTGSGLAGQGAWRNFLGDIVISVETARYNAHREGHALENELRWLIVHGALHLLGYDHEQDGGEMTRLELSLRGRLGIGEAGSKPRRQRMARR